MTPQPVLTSAQIREWDQLTILNEPIEPIELMERAAATCVNWIDSNVSKTTAFVIFCGSGNNGGDGLAIARMLFARNHRISVVLVDANRRTSPLFDENLRRLPNGISVISGSDFPRIDEGAIIIDAIFGTGMHGTISGVAASTIEWLNQLSNRKISIDLPSGLSADKSVSGNAIVRATVTLTFQAYKPALLFADNLQFLGKIVVLDIGLNLEMVCNLHPSNFLIDPEFVKSCFRPRSSGAHKGVFGQVLILAGSKGKMGAALLATSACVKSGAGLITVLIPASGYSIIQTGIPEAMALIDPSDDHLSKLPEEIDKYGSIGIGPGIGTHSDTVSLVSFLIRRSKKPLVIDADALNILSARPELLKQIPKRSIITPHPKEFERLFGACENESERISLASKNAGELEIIIILKGHHTLVALPNGERYFNTTGNAGMAKGGSGDVLTGILTALLGQGYKPDKAAVLGVFLHGKAGDLAAERSSFESVTPSDLINFLGKAFRTLYPPPPF